MTDVYKRQEEDLAGAGYNVNQSKIAIGSGGLTGKGFLNGTQTKLKYCLLYTSFPDCVEIAGNEGVTAVIQPGGSINDEVSFEYCNEHGIAMVTSRFRHFKH